MLALMEDSILEPSLLSSQDMVALRVSSDFRLGETIHLSG